MIQIILVQRLDLRHRSAIVNPLPRDLAAQQPVVRFHTPFIGVQPPELAGNLQAGAYRLELATIGDHDPNSPARLVGKLAGLWRESKRHEANTGKARTIQGLSQRPRC